MDQGFFDVLNSLGGNGVLFSALVLALVVAVISVLVAATRYLQAARMQNFARTVNAGVRGEEARSSLERLISSGLRDKLQKKTFLEKYREVGGGHRFLFAAGCTFCLLTLVLTLLWATWQFIRGPIRGLAADTAIAYRYDVSHAMTDFISNLAIIVLSSGLLFTLFWGATLFVFHRWRAVLAVQMNRSDAVEPPKVDRLDVAVCSVGVGFPVMVVALIIAMFDSLNTFPDYRDAVTGNYAQLISIPNSGNENQQAAVRRWVRNLFGAEELDEWERKLAMAAVTEGYLVDDRSSSSYGVTEEDLVVAALFELDPLVVDLPLFILQSYFKSRDPYGRWPTLRDTIVSRIQMAALLGEGFGLDGGDSAFLRWLADPSSELLGDPFPEIRSVDSISTAAGTAEIGSRIHIGRPQDISEGPGWISEMDDYSKDAMTVSSITRVADIVIIEVEENLFKWDPRWVTMIE